MVEAPPLRVSPNAVPILTAQRENGHIPGFSSSSDFAGSWVVRDDAGSYITHNSYLEPIQKRWPDLKVIAEFRHD